MGTACSRRRALVRKDLPRGVPGWSELAHHFAQARILSASIRRFDIARVASFGPRDIERLVADAGIVRHRGKIASAINNAQRYADLATEFGSLDAFVWSFVTSAPAGDEATTSGIPTYTPASTRLSKELKQRGWTFVGPTTMYAFMQSVGVVNDHLKGCWAYQDVQA